MATEAALPSALGERRTNVYDLQRLGADWIVKTAQDGQPFAEFGRQLEVSPNDARQYRLITLSNGLRALLISGETDKAAAALSVGIGHLSDPEDLPGLAHYTEHLLFLGSSRYPDEADYKRYLSANGGSTNAFTSMDETCYHFDCTPAGLAGALSRHSQFFVAPLFDPSCTEREVNAVDSEFKRNLQLDSRRLFQLGKATSAAAHPYRKFGTGSKETLWYQPRQRGEDVRERLLQWYSQHYSANLMNLVVFSSHSLDELTDLAVAEYSAVPNLDVCRPAFDPAVFGPEQFGTEVSYRTIKDSPQLRVEFPLPDLSAFWRTKPGQFLTHYVGHEGEGSILDTLKKRGWATQLSAGSSGGAAGFDFFRCDVSLSAAGLTHYREVLSTIFDYVQLLQQTPLQRWAFEETSQLGKLSWRWKENSQPTPLVRSLASRLTQDNFPPESLLIGPYFATVFDEQAIANCLSRLQPSNCRVLVGSKDPLQGRTYWAEKEEYYGTEYEIRPLDLPAAVPAADLALPKPNIFVPEKLELLTTTPATEPAKRPSLIRSTKSARLFWKRDDTWLVPRGTASFLLKSPITDLSPVDAMLSQLFAALVEESLSAYSYDASLAGLAYSVGNEPDGIQIVASGYSEKLALLLEVVVKRMKNFVVDPGQFELVHDRLTRAYKNAKQNNPSTIADTHLRHLTRQTHWTIDDRLDALAGLRLSDVESHARKLLERLYIDGLAHGNIRREDALKMLDMIEGTLASAVADPADNDYHRALVLPSGSNLVYRTDVPSIENVNSAATVYYQVGESTDHHEEARLSLFAQIAKVPVFSTLRTKEQLGYIVGSSVWSLNSYHGFRVVVQSERTGEYLEERIEAMWRDSFNHYLEEMSEEDFASQRQSLVSKKLEKAKNLSQETNRYWSEVESGELDFHRRERQAGLIAKLTKDDIVSFFRQCIHPDSSRRVKLSILMRSQRLQPLATEPLLERLREMDFGDRMANAIKLLQGKPTAAELHNHFQELFKDSEVPAGVRDELQKIAARPPLAEGVEEIAEDDVEAFRARLERAPPVVAAADYSADLEAHAHL